MFLNLFFIRAGARALGVLALACALGGPLPALADAGATPPDLFLEAMQALSEGRLDDAHATVSRLQAQPPENAGAWLDLAVLQCSLGNAAEADRLLADIASRFSPPADILDLMAQQRAQGCAVQQAAAQDYARVRMGRGVDSNANQGASSLNFSVGSGSQQLDLMLLPQYAPRGDQFTWLEAELGRQLTPGGGSGFLNLQARRNDVEAANNLVALNLGLEQTGQAGGWDWRGAASAGLVQLGSALYQQQGQLQMLASRALGARQESSLTLLGNWTLLHYPAQAQPDAHVWQLRSLLAHRWGDARLQASGGYAYDQPLGQRPGGGRRGWGASAGVDMPLWNTVMVGAHWSRQNWSGQAVYSPGLIDRAREQRTDVLRATLTLPLAAGQSVQLEWREVRNHENISIFQYASRVLQLSWQWQLGK